jgi:predicted transcriptional regulator
MARNTPPVDVNLTTDVDARLDEIAEQLQSVASALRDALDRVVAGEITTDQLDSFRSAADTLVHAWELEADLLRRRPR